MRSITVYPFSFLLLFCGAMKAQPPSSEPIFGMIYDAKLIHFEQAPASILEHCKTLKDLRSKPFWVFAHAKREGTEYFILSNRTTDVSGVGLVMRGSECVEWLPERIINGESTDGKEALPKWAPLTDPVLQALSEDAFRRYSQAFGGKKNFLETLHKGGLPPQELPKVLRDELAVFSREP
jgi:hypothetical protein